jgi:predicted RNase H-like nuclease (RuvC/YqgF family)
MMFDILKKLDEDQNNGELNSEEPNENIEEKITVEELIKEEGPTEESSNQQPYQTEEGTALAMLEELGVEERALLAERSQLVNMEASLKQRIREEINIRRSKIEILKQEIPELKQRCEALAKVLDIPVQK